MLLMKGNVSLHRHNKTAFRWIKKPISLQVRLRLADSLAFEGSELMNCECVRNAEAFLFQMLSSSTHYKEGDKYGRYHFNLISP